jgi:methyltransferase (TIGR00027 family)
VSRPRLVGLPRTLHTTDRPSATAQWTTLGRALELHRPAGDRIVSDPFAPVFLSGANRKALGLLPTTGPVGPVVHRLERTGVAGIATSALCRHAFIDAHLLESLPEVEQIVVLGAGYDSRAYRFARAIGGRPVFEVDLPPLSRLKAAIVRDHPDRFRHATVHRVEIDFRTQSLRTRLAESGLRLGVPSFVVWEGVSMYLSRDAVLDTLAALAVVCGRGSVLAMDFWQDVPGHAPLDRIRRTAVRSMRLIGEPITFALPSTAATDFLTPTGFRTLDLATGSRLTTRYSTGGRTCDEGLYVVAAGLR